MTSSPHRLHPRLIDFLKRKDVAASQNKWFVVCFGAAWCSLARRLVESFELGAKTRPDVVFCVFQYDELVESEEVADLTALPCVKFYPPGKPAFVRSGLSSFTFLEELPRKS
jgi:hypothetical protein